MNPKLVEPMEIVHGLLKDYTESKLSSDAGARKKIDRAWSTVVDSVVDGPSKGTKSALENIWDALEAYHEAVLQEGGETCESQWEDTCAAFKTIEAHFS